MSMIKPKHAVTPVSCSMNSNRERVCKHKTAVTMVYKARIAKHHPRYTLLIMVGVVSSYTKRGRPSKHFPSRNVLVSPRQSDMQMYASIELHSDGD